MQSCDLPVHILNLLVKLSYFPDYLIVLESRLPYLYPSQDHKDDVDADQTADKRAENAEQRF